MYYLHRKSDPCFVNCLLHEVHWVHYDCTCIMPIYYLLCNNSTNKMAASLEHSRFIELGVHSDSI